MKRKTKNKIIKVIKALLAAAFGFAGASLTNGCTTINFPADETRPTSFNGVTNLRVK